MSEIRGAVWVLAVGMIIAGLYYGRAILSPLALAAFLFLVMEGFARTIDNASTLIDRLWGRVIALITVLGGFGVFLAMLAQSIASIGADWRGYETRINELFVEVYSLFGQTSAPTISGLLLGGDGGGFLSQVAGAVRSISENLVLIILYVVFMYIAQASWSRKLDNIFPDKDAREQARSVSDAARASIEMYLWTQTVISIIITVLTYISLTVLGVPNAVLLAALIFVLNYIPTIGSIIAAFIPLLFAMAQPSELIPGWVPGEAPHNSYIYSAIVFGVVSFWQFSIGNFVQPRMMGESLNLSALVVLVSLAVWGALWGIAGMFLSAPLTVIIMIVCAQSKSSRWVAIILSADGEPGIPKRVEAAPADADKEEDESPVSASD